MKTFFLGGDHLNLDKKAIDLLGKTQRIKSFFDFSGKSLVPPQIILSSYAHAEAQKLLVGRNFATLLDVKW